VVAYIDPCLCCNDRVAVVKDSSGRILDYSYLHKKAVEKTKRLEKELGVKK